MLSLTVRLLTLPLYLNLYLVEREASETVLVPGTVHPRTLCKVQEDTVQVVYRQAQVLVHCRCTSANKQVQTVNETYNLLY